MNFPYFSLNGEILPSSQAMVPLDNIAYAYGYGVYETIRTRNGEAVFIDEHCARLLQSAEIIGLSHTFDTVFIKKAIVALTHKTDSDSYNLKIVLIGGREPQLYIQCLNPQFPDRKLYKTGAKTITRHFERVYPQAKSLNMFQSYKAYDDALKVGAYEALLVNNSGEITEGTRSNFFGLNGSVIISPPEKDVLGGVTRLHLLKLAKAHGYHYEEHPIDLESVQKLESVFLSSTTFKIMPIREIDDMSWDIPQPDPLKKLMQLFDDFIRS